RRHTRFSRDWSSDVCSSDLTFPHPGKIGAIEADFNSETGNIPFRADFPNPKGLLRHGQTGTIRIHRELDDALVIPQRATFEILEIGRASCRERGEVSGVRGL